ncbi:MAG: hypothetical protein AAFQ58_10750 [Pseudomonadota bacterium]
MMYAIALTALGLGIVAGWSLAARFMVRSLVGLVLVLIGAVLFVGLAPDKLPGDGFAAVVATYLVALPMASGLLGGGVFRWLVQRHRSAA